MTNVLKKLFGFFRNLRIRSKLLAIYLSIFVIIFVVTGSAIYFMVERSIGNYIQNELNNATTTIMNMVKTVSETSIKNYLRAVAEKNREIVDYYYRKWKKGEISEDGAKQMAREVLLSQHIGETGYIFVWDVTNEPWRIPLVVHPKIQGHDIADVEFVRKGVAMKNGYMEYAWKNPGEPAPREKAMYLSYFEPWRWVIAASSYKEEFRKLINVDSFRKEILSLKFGKTGYPYVIDGKGNVVIHPIHTGNVYNERDIDGRMFIKELIEKKKGTLTYNWKNPDEKRPREKIVIFDYLPELDWYVVSSGYLEEFYQPLTDFKKTAAIILALSLIVVIFFSYMVSSMITKPLERFTDKLRARDNEGVFSAQIDSDSKDEISQLTSYFKNYMEKLEEYGESLRAQISERVQAEERYRSIFENAVEGIFQSTPDGRFIRVNPAFARMEGYDSPEEMVGDVVSIDAQLYVDGEDRKRFMRIIEKVGLVERFETRHRRKDGSAVWVSISAHAVKDDAGNTLYYEGTAEDITERKLAEEALLKSEETVRILLNANPETMFLLNRDGFILTGNDIFPKRIGRTIGSMIGTYHFDYLPENVAEDRKLHFDETVVTGKMINFVDTYGGFIFDNFYYPIVDEHGDVDKVAIFANDITERRKTENALFVERDKLQTLAENAPLGMLLISSEGHFAYANNKFRDLFGYDADDVPDGKAWFRRAYPDKEYRQKVISAWIEDFTDLKPGERKPRTFTVTCKNEKQKIIEFIPLRLASGDYLMTCEDITELKRLESQLIHSQKMEAIGTLAAGIAHDFNNILTTIMGYSNLLHMKMESVDPLRQYAEHILTASQKAANLTQSLLTFSRLQPANLIPLNINDTIRGTEKLLARLLTEDIELKTSLAQESLIARADATQIDQILFNLVTNARDAMPKGGCISIETRTALIDDEFVRIHGFGKPDHYVQVIVSDTGMGMDKITREKIFDPFFTTKEVGKGTGLGLASVYGIVKQHNGYITVYSEPGIGTSFHIYLPAMSIQVDDKYQKAPVLQRGVETILIAEDDEGVRELMRETLRLHGYKTIEAVDGEDAVGKFRQHGDISLIVVDSVMPKKNGREVYEEIRGVDPAVKVLFTSGYTRDIVLDKGIEDRKFAFVAKPLSPTEFLQKVRLVLDGAELPVHED